MLLMLSPQVLVYGNYHQNYKDKLANKKILIENHMSIYASMHIIYAHCYYTHIEVHLLCLINNVVFGVCKFSL